MSSLPFTYLMQGEILSALGWVFNSYIGYGLLWILLGGVMFVVVYGKTQSFGISGLLLVIYSILVGPFLPVEVQSYVLLLVIVLSSILLIKVVW